MSNLFFFQAESAILELQTQLSQSEEMKRTFHEHLEKAKEELDGVGRQKEEDEQNNSALTRKIAMLEQQVCIISWFTKYCNAESISAQ